VERAWWDVEKMLAFTWNEMSVVGKSGLSSMVCHVRRWQLAALWRNHRGSGGTVSAHERAYTCVHARSCQQQFGEL
jgi:hypothetical protein